MLGVTPSGVVPTAVAMMEQSDLGQPGLLGSSGPRARGPLRHLRRLPGRVRNPSFRLLTGKVGAEGVVTGKRGHRGGRGGRGRGRGRTPVVLAAACASLLAACDVEWGGGRVALEDPAPAPDPAEAVPAEEAPEAPLPRGPLLYMVRAAGGPEAGGALVVAVARLDGAPAPLELPPAPTERWRARFDSTFLAPGSELRLHAGGARIGTLVLEGEAFAPDASCPSVGRGTALLLPGQRLPPLAFALAPEGPSPEIRPLPRRAPDPRMAVTGPVLAERLIGGPRAYMARRAALSAVPLAVDSVPAMAGTWLVNDSLAPGPPGNNAISLFFLARYAPVRGYVPVWSLVRRYDDPSEKEAFEHLDWIRLPEGRLDLLRRVDASGEGLAASLLPSEEGEEGEALPGTPEQADEAAAARELDWVESGPCRGQALLEAAAGR